MLTLARRDLRRFTTGEWSETITLTPVGGSSYTVTGTASKHFNSMSTDGIPMRGKNAHVTIVEADLVSQNYPVRNHTGDVAMKDHYVDVPDSTGVVKHYIVQDSFPDEALGTILLILGERNVSYN